MTAYWISATAKRRRATRRPLAHMVGVAAVTVLVGACVSSGVVPRWEIPPGVSPAESAEEFGQNLGMARAIGALCGGYGISQTYNDTREVAGYFEFDLAAKSYTEAEKQQISDRFFKAYNFTVDSYASRPTGDIDSLCKRARQDIANGSELGRFLRSTK